MNETLTSAAKETLKELENTSEFSKYLPFAISALKASGAVRFLRELGRPKAVPTTTDHFVEAQAFESQRAIGYNQALDDLLQLRERFLDTQTQNPEQPTMDYGGGAAAMFAGDLNKEELDAVISGTDPSIVYERLYREHTRPAAGDKSGVSEQ